jgi:hypothetical protein
VRDEFGADIAAVDPIELAAAVNGAVEREHQKKFLQIQIRKLTANPAEIR